MKPFFFVLFLSACVTSSEPKDFKKTCPGRGDYEYADVVVVALGDVSSTSAVNIKTNAINGVRGNKNAGSQDVLSRGYDIDSGNNILILEWEGRKVVNSPGADFVIFENAFEVNEDHNFMDLIIVSVSNDLVNWSTFPHDYIAVDETKYSHNPDDWVGFGGVEATRFNSDDQTCIDPMGPATGGDKFDLDSLDEGDALRNEFRYLRLQSAPTVKNPDTGEVFVRDFISDGFDLDGVYARTTSER